MYLGSTYVACGEIPKLDINHSARRCTISEEGIPATGLATVRRLTVRPNPTASLECELALQGWIKMAIRI